MATVKGTMTTPICKYCIQCDTGKKRDVKLYSTGQFHCLSLYTVYSHEERRKPVLCISTSSQQTCGNWAVKFRNFQPLIDLHKYPLPAAFPSWWNLLPVHGQAGMRAQCGEDIPPHFPEILCPSNLLLIWRHQAISVTISSLFTGSTYCAPIALLHIRHICVWT